MLRESLTLIVVVFFVSIIMLTGVAIQKLDNELAQQNTLDGHDDVAPRLQRWLPKIYFVIVPAIILVGMSIWAIVRSSTNEAGRYSRGR